MRTNKRKNNTSKNDVNKRLRASLLDTICNMMEEAKQTSPTNRLPHAFITKILAEMKDTYPWISRSIINHHYSERQKKHKDHLTIISRSTDQLSAISPLTDISNPSSNDEVTVSNEDDEVAVSNEDACSSTRKCPGRPRDLTISLKHHKKKSILTLNNEISTRF